jgi:hypothetical protein
MRVLFRRLQFLLNRRRYLDDLETEMRLHRDCATSENLGFGKKRTLVRQKQNPAIHALAVLPTAPRA